MNDDVAQLRRFAESQDQSAFSAVVGHHLSWVYHAALRRTGGRSDLAQDVVQYVFLALAKNAPALSRRDSLAGWLHITTRFAAHRLMRAEHRRKVHESAAMKEEPTRSEHGPGDAWADVRPVLDELLDRLSPQDRDAVLRRHFAGEDYASIGHSLGLSEEAARKRVDRGLEKLRSLLARRGIASTGAALSGLLAARSGAAVPDALAASISQTALAGTAAPLPGATGLAFAHFMATGKIVGTAAGLAAVLLLTSLGVGGFHANAAREAEAELALEQQRLALVQQKLRARTVSPGPSTPPATPAAEVNSPAASESRANAAPTAPRRETNDAQEFFAAFPQARAMLHEIGRMQIARNYAMSYRLVGLTPSEREQFESETSRYWDQYAMVTPESIHPTRTELPDEQLRAIFGEEKFKRWQQSNRPGMAQGWAKILALKINSYADPLSFDQVFAIASAISDHSPDYRQGGQVSLEHVDWAPALEDVKGILTPAQWEAAQPFLLRGEFQAQMRRLERAKNP